MIPKECNQWQRQTDSRHPDNSTYRLNRPREGFSEKWVGFIFIWPLWYVEVEDRKK